MPAALAVLSVVPSIFLQPLGWPLPLIAMTALAILLALPIGWPRVTFAVVWAATVTVFSVEPSGGGVVVGNDTTDYLLFTMALVWLVISLITLPQRRPEHSDPQPEPA